MKRFLAFISVLLVTVGLSASGRAGAAGSDQFTLSADFTGLYPNADLTVPVTVHNLQTYDVAVRAATVIVGDASAACGATNVVAHLFSGDVVVASGAGATIPVRLQMLAGAPDACQGVTFPLTFDAHGVIVNFAGRTAGSTPTSGFAITGFGSGVQMLGAVGLAVALAGLLLAGRRTKLSSEGQ